MIPRDRFNFRSTCFASQNRPKHLLLFIAYVGLFAGT
jgi:hypothetical protein